MSAVTRTSGILLQNVYALIISAAIMCAFEIIFIYRVVFPGIRKKLFSQLDELRSQNAWLDSVNSRRNATAIVHALAGREAHDAVKVNEYTITLGSILLLLLLMCIATMHRMMRARGVGTRGPIVSSVTTVAVLILFQMFFYFGTSRSYRYASSANEFFEIAFHGTCDDVGDVELDRSVEAALSLINHMQNKGYDLQGRGL